MTKEEFIKAKQIQATLAFSLANVKFETVTLAESGDVINLSGREVGAEVFVGDGEAVADGTYVLSDGFEFEVTDSKISKVISEVKADESEEVATEELAEEVAEDVASTVNFDDFKALQDEVSQLKDALQSLMDSMDASKSASVEKEEEFNKKVSSINAAFAALAKLPTEGSKVNESPKSLAKKEKDNSAFRNLYEASKQSTK
jgi:hypothetical protein